MSLREKNADNCLVERANNASLRLTRAYEAAAGSSAGVGDLDVSARLQPFFSYTEEEKALLVASKDVVEASGPLPLFMTMWVAGQRVLAAKGEAEEKKKRDEIKANPAGQTLKGAVPAGPTHRISSLVTSEIEIPKPFLGCLVQKIPVPLHWWTNSNLRKANNNPHWLPWRELTIEGKKILILETAKGEKILGDVEDEFKNLSPGKWREASVNFARALRIVSQEVPADAPPGWSNTAIKYEQHVRFFAQVDDFDDTFPIWFKVEKDLRDRVLKGGAFVESTWESKIGVMNAAHNPPPLS
ncbi:hypothetical protein DFH08DRAFT_816467 [Mycena albidolilacea]|uniref:Uncharacterized protein n=1 Tax=Mycena albidolilacea TaxID=1033008 RepID=A0AAD6ZLK5_9AGAR|nr:hypothetical protein DFH08DRAFT_816467 [Mycena albidolilacea]